MSNGTKALAQQATNLAPSGNTEDNFDIVACITRCAERTAKGATRERKFLQYNKLVSAACADYRGHFPMIYGKSERLPSNIFEKIENAVNEFISKTLNAVNVTNVIGQRRGFYHNQREMEVTERVTNVGENKLTLQEQLLGVNIFIGQAEKRLKDLQQKPTPDYEREKEVKQQIMRLQVTKDFILGEIKHQEKAKEESKQ